jgi:hypothetical protein
VDESIHALLRRNCDSTLPGVSDPVAGLESWESQAPSTTLMPRMQTFETYPPPSIEQQQPIAHGRTNTNGGLDSSHIEGDQDRLRDAREDLLGARYQLKNKRGELRDLRQKTGLEEGAVINQLRQAFQERDIEFPVELKIAFNSVIRLRDSLGIFEGSYEEEEEKYDNLEWDYTKKEEDFVAKWIGDQVDIPPTQGKSGGTNDPNLPFYGLAEIGEPSIEFEEPRPESTNFFQNGMRQPPEYSEIIWTHSKQQSASTAPENYQRRHSYSQSNLCRQDVAANYPLPRANSETGVSEARMKWTDTRKRIDTWILDTVSCSHYQKLILRSMLAQDDLDYTTWWKLVTQNWISDSPSTPPSGMDGNESINSIETVHPPIAFGAVSSVSGKANTEHPELESEFHSTPDRVKDLSAQSTGTSVTTDSIHRQNEMHDFGKSEMLSLTSLEQSEGQPEGVSSPQTIISVEKIPSENYGSNFGPAGILDPSLTTKNRHKEPKTASRSTASENDLPGDTVPGHFPHHIRRSSNPEPRRFIPIHHQLRHHEDFIKSIRPYSSDFAQIEHTVHTILFPRTYGQRPPSPPETRTQSPRNPRLEISQGRSPKT